jgi:Competence protein CoiA-like family
MNVHLLYGAKESESGRHVRPDQGIRGTKTYVCPKCDLSVCFKNGKVRRPHFAHKPGSACNHYSGGGEGAIHKEAKEQLAQMLKDRAEIVFKHRCVRHGHIIAKVVYQDGDQVHMEYRLPDKGRADIALLSKEGDVRYVFEICDTNPTLKPRPEPWFEVKALDVLQAHSEEATFYCCRSRKCPDCVIENHMQEQVARFQHEAMELDRKQRIHDKAMLVERHRRHQDILAREAHERWIQATALAEEVDCEWAQAMEEKYGVKLVWGTYRTETCKRTVIESIEDDIKLRQQRAADALRRQQMDQELAEVTRLKEERAAAMIHKFKYLEVDREAREAALEADPRFVPYDFKCAPGVFRSDKVVAAMVARLLLTYQSIVVKIPRKLKIASYGWWNKLRVADAKTRVAMAREQRRELNVIEDVTDTERAAMAATEYHTKVACSFTFTRTIVSNSRLSPNDQGICGGA